MTETLANGYSFESAQRELSNAYQHYRVQMVIKKICVIVLWMKVVSALERLILRYLAWIKSRFLGCRMQSSVNESLHVLN